ncbi:hypothetical protein BD289DRAFT_454092 [Coniella lustricola]|uniref:Cyclin-dependent kinase n=1 Tax=Coniella lustricola TaxID=2025994 RepID=A0A2T3A4U1_9PEZI|nr:hypothetical protein BD289DRAFT_454092 [Coniella lustricola]
MSFRPVNTVPAVRVADSITAVAPVAVAAAAAAAAAAPAPAPASSSASASTPSPATGSHPVHKHVSRNANPASTTTDSHTSNSRVFSPPAVERSASNGAASSSGNASSQDSQLLQLSQLAAAREKMPDLSTRPAVKRTADGAPKKDQARSSSTSPARHSRNMSGVSTASTSSSRVTELSSELKARLSYAMLKINHGWQSRTIDEVENLASNAGSPASSNSTLPGVVRTSVSPPLASSHSTDQTQQQQTAWRGPSASPAPDPGPAQHLHVPSLAPPVYIQPHRSEMHSRRNANPKQTPHLLPAKQSHHNASHAPTVPALTISRDSRQPRTVADPMVASPTHHNNREKDAMEALLFMSSPGNSANLKHHFPAPQPLSQLRNGTTLSAASAHRTALPTSAPKRKSLPNGRPAAPSSQPLPAAHSPKKRVGFQRSRQVLDACFGWFQQACAVETEVLV